MSEKIRHTLLNHEVNPPPAVWPFILAELNEQDQLRQVGQQLGNAAVVPPAENWSKLLSSLEEISIGRQLAETEVAPPAGTWKKIARELNTDESSAVKKITPWWRYAAAAAILITAGLGIFRFTRPAVPNEEIAIHNDSIQHTDQVKKEQRRETLEEIVSIAPEANEEARNDAALEASKKTFARLEYPAKKIAREVSAFYFNAYPSSVSGRGLDVQETTAPETSKAERYITLMTPEGNIIRVSKKLGGMVCCISGEAEDPACTDQLKKWREKIVASPLGHSADSFLELLQLVNAAEEN